MPASSPDPPLELPESAVSPAFKAHLSQFARPTSPSLRRSPRKIIASDSSSALRLTPTRVRLSPKQTPPRSRDSVSPHFNKNKRSSPEQTSAPSTESVKKKKKPSRPYADPSTYSELGDDPLTDYLEKDLDLLLCGINPGLKSAQMGQHYASPTNHFWKALAGSGLTDRLLHPSEGATLPDLYNIGSTNLVPRPSAEMSELSLEEMRACVPALLRKIINYKPRMVAFVGMKICEIVFRHLWSLLSVQPSPVASASQKRRKIAMPKIKIGLQPFFISLPPELDSERRKILFWCLPSTSARVVEYQLVDKIRIFKLLKEEVQSLKSGTLEVFQDAFEYKSEVIFDVPSIPVETVQEEETKKWNLTLIRSEMELRDQKPSTKDSGNHLETYDTSGSDEVKLET
ncbi:hypothetical protein JCM3765_005354 [Sporobolomyces pararoseus]